MFHCVLRAIGIALTEFPRLNRYVSGSRLYARTGVWLAFSAKQRLERDAPLFTAKVKLEPDEPLGAFVDRILDVLGDGRSGKESAADREIKGFLKLPGPILRAAVRLQRALDGWNLLPLDAPRRTIRSTRRPSSRTWDPSASTPRSTISTSTGRSRSS